jgi:4,5-DOPA dioxygenase extradiol
MSTPLPFLFLSHGAPTLALDPGPPGELMQRLGRQLPRPAAILVVSAHWGTAAPALSAAALPETIHDFYGFPAPLYALRYPAPGAPQIAARALDLLRAQGHAASLDPDQGLDHGAWVPLRFLFPDADVPVLQLSLQPHLDARHHYEIGRALAPLAQEGVLVIGSGGISHNLREYRPGAERSPAPAWMQVFVEWMADALAAGDVEALLDYRRRAPEAVRNHPTDEHLLPLFTALGAAGTQAVRRHTTGETYGLLAMDSFSWGLPAAGSGAAAQQVQQ